MPRRVSVRRPFSRPSRVEPFLIREIGRLHLTGNSPAKIASKIVEKYGDLLPPSMRTRRKIKVWSKSVFGKKTNDETRQLLSESLHIPLSRKIDPRSRSLGMGLTKKQIDLILNNQGAVAFLCKKYGQKLLIRGISLDDLVGEVNTKLLEVIDQYDGSHSITTFISFKTQGVLNKLFRGLTTNKKDGGKRIRSLDYRTSSDRGLAIVDARSPRPEDEAYVKELAPLFDRVRRILGEKKFSILSRSLEGESHAEIARTYNVSRAYIHEVIRDALALLRTHPEVRKFQ